MSTPWVETDPDAWDKPVLAGFVFPGTSSVDGDLKQRLEERTASGAHGGQLTARGYQLSRVTITTELASAEDWDQWQALLAIIRPQPDRGETDPRDIIHPVLNAYGITSVVVEAVGFPRKLRAGVMTVTTRVVEWRPYQATDTTKVLTGSVATTPPLTSLPIAEPTQAPSNSEVGP